MDGYKLVVEKFFRAAGVIASESGLSPDLIMEFDEFDNRIDALMDSWQGCFNDLPVDNCVDDLDQAVVKYVAKNSPILGIRNRIEAGHYCGFLWCEVAEFICVLYKERWSWQ